MPDLVQVQNVTCPAGTPASAPLETVLVGVVGVKVIRFIVVMPAGHAGTTGIALGYGHNAVLPYSGGFVSGDGEVLDFELTTAYPDGPQWSAFTCNTDTQAHSWQVRAEVNNLVVTPVAVMPQPLAPEVIYQSSTPLVIPG